MKSETIKYAIENLKNRKLRSWLTVVSILIGIMAIFALVSFGAGVQNYVNTLSEEMGIDKIIIQPGGFQPLGSSTVDFTDSDIKTIEKVRGVEGVVPMFATQVEIQNDPDKVGKWAYIMGMPTDNEKIKIAEESFGMEFEKGRNLKKNDKFKVVLGYNYQLEDKIFSEPVKLRDKIYIKEKGFKVIGFYEQIGNPSDDSNVYLTNEIAHELFNTQDYQMIFVKTMKNEDPKIVSERIKKELRKNRGLDEGKEDFTVQTFEDAIAIFTNIISILNGVLILIALISVIVSAINIANSMYTSVIERTNEIGVMKAIGAKNTTIKSLFLIESGLLGLIGGAIGIFLGYLVATTGGKIAAQAGYPILKPIFPWWLIFGCLTFSFIVGMISGFFPANQASKLKPVDALRYE